MADGIKRGVLPVPYYNTIVSVADDWEMWEHFLIQDVFFFLY
jgi:hypothetical protein